MARGYDYDQSIIGTFKEREFGGGHYLHCGGYFVYYLAGTIADTSVADSGTDSSGGGRDLSGAHNQKY